MHGGDVWREGIPGDWLDFSANIRPGGPPDWVKAALAAGMAEVAYYPDLRVERARRALGEYLNLPPDWVLPTAGGISAIALAARLAPEMIAFGPCFGEYAEIAGQFGVPVREISLLAGREAPRGAVPLNEQRDCCATDSKPLAPRDCREFTAPSEALRENLSPGAAVWLCNPLNPVGIATSRAEILALLRQIEAADGWLVLDEAFIHCCPERTSVDLLAKHPRLVILGSLTKSLGIPGARAGYICANPEILSELARRQRSWELNCFAESMIRELPNHAAELREEAALNAVRRENLRRGLESLGAYVYPSEACFLLADFGREIEPVVRILRERGILVRTCADFHGIDGGSHLRLAVKDEAANARLLRELEAALCAENR